MGRGERSHLLGGTKSRSSFHEASTRKRARRAWGSLPRPRPRSQAQRALYKWSSLIMRFPSLSCERWMYGE